MKNLLFSRNAHFCPKMIQVQFLLRTRMQLYYFLCGMGHVICKTLEFVYLLIELIGTLITNTVELGYNELSGTG